jgi:valyl-tRNA synthetase
MPFLTEEIWHLLSPRKEGEDLMVSQLRTLTVKSENKPLLVFFPHIQQAITELRSLRNQHQISPKQTLQLWINPLNLQEYTPGIIALIQKMGNFSPIEFTIEKINGATYKLIDQDEFYILLESVIDPEIEKQKLTEELNYQEGFLISVRKKLENEKFRLNAKPEIIAAEEKKQQDSESRIRVIKDRLKEL